MSKFYSTLALLAIFITIVAYLIFDIVTGQNPQKPISPERQSKIFYPAKIHKKSEATVDAGWKSEAQKCFKSFKKSDFKDLNSLFKSLVDEAESSQLNLKNLHYLIDNQELRLQIVAQDKIEGNTRQMQIKVFSVDTEGLPVPQKIPAELAEKSNEEIISAYAKQGELTFEESSYSYNLANNINMLVHYKNKSIDEAQVFLPGGLAFNCAQNEDMMECVCQ